MAFHSSSYYLCGVFHQLAMILTIIHSIGSEPVISVTLPPSKDRCMLQNYKRKQNKCNGNAGKLDLAGSLHVIGNQTFTTI